MVWLGPLLASQPKMGVLVTKAIMIVRVERGWNDPYQFAVVLNTAKDHRDFVIFMIFPLL
jgi:hypothetical protein